MGLSAYERRILVDIEDSLAQSDPRFVRKFPWRAEPMMRREAS
jgi:hypothetical protein